ncbi:MAG TPA: TIGR03667 family PPOX class F420-dependent oxidoreductase [Ktedonosporobacter sp.]|nr:TIGR03667 family PPOX class F420-dependent oxidoreductase [Ktedonosporobacter sp.]
MLNLNNKRDAHIDQRLRSEPMIWFSTVRPDGRPHLVPVWFFWDGATMLIFSQPDNQKIRNLRNNPAVSLALEAANQGEDIVMLEGTATLVDEPGLKASMPAYAKKYDALLKRMGMSATQMAASYSQAIRITPTRFIAWGV